MKVPSFNISDRVHFVLIPSMYEGAGTTPDIKQDGSYILEGRVEGFRFDPGLGWMVGVHNPTGTYWLEEKYVGTDLAKAVKILTGETTEPVVSSNGRRDYS